MQYYIIYKQAGKSQEQVCVFGQKLLAIDKAREIDAQLLPWEKIEIKKLDGNKLTEVPHKVFLAETHSKKIIEEIKGQKLNDALEEAIGIMHEYEKDDELSELYVDGWYDIIDEAGNSYIYNDDCEAGCAP